MSQIRAERTGWLGHDRLFVAEWVCILLRTLRRVNTIVDVDYLSTVITPDSPLPFQVNHEPKEEILVQHNSLISNRIEGSNDRSLAPGASGLAFVYFGSRPKSCHLKQLIADCP